MKGFITLAVLLGLGALAQASDSATQTVTFEVKAINEIAIHGSPNMLHATPGRADSDSRTTYAISTNEDDRKIMVSLGEPLPEGAILTVNLKAPSGATSLGDVVLSDTPADAVIGISRLAEKNLTITYTLRSTKGEVSFEPKKLILTIAHM
jgi:hypothetical protein